MALDIVVVNDDSTRVELEAAIKVLATKRDRMPKHWAERRQVLADEIDELVDRWIEVGPGGSDDVATDADHARR